MDHEQIIANLRREWSHLHDVFKYFFRESMSLRSYLLLYATTEDKANRETIDKELEQEFPDIFQEIQEWRNGVPRDEEEKDAISL